MKTNNVRPLSIVRTMIGIGVLSFLIACNLENPSEKAINDFVKIHTTYGAVQFTSAKPDWAEGKRSKVVTDKGNYLFYLSKTNEVVGVWQENEDGTKTQLFKKESTEFINQINEDRNLPQYKILSQVDLFSGEGKFGEILVLSYSTNTPKEEIESTLRQIMEKKGFASAMIYCTEAAYKANSSESFSKSHPNALENGYLGQVTEKGKFLE